MKIILAEAVHCEHAGAYGYEAGHIKGNQTGDELRTILYYNKPWNYVYRAKDPEVAKEIAIRQKQAVDNKHIGYGQATRNGYMEQLLKANYDPSKITMDCDCDCSSLTNANVFVTLLSRGIRTSITGYENTTLMPAAYAKATAYFDNITSKVNLATGSGLQPGDILLKSPAAHVAVVWSVEEDIKAPTYSQSPKWVGSITKACKVYADLVTKAPLAAWSSLNVGNLVDVCDTPTGYYYIRIAGKYFGFVDKANLVNVNSLSKPVVPTPDTSTTSVYGVTTTALNCRTDANATSAVVCVLPQNAKVEILGQKVASNGTTWYQVKYGTKIGYCSGKYITGIAGIKKGIVTQALYLRSDANTNSTTLGILNANTVIIILGQKTDSRGVVWYKTTMNGKTGYCSSKYVKLN